MKNKKMILIVCTLLLVSLVGIGCKAAEKPVPNQQTTDRNKVTNEKNIPRTDEVLPKDNEVLPKDNEINKDKDTITEDNTNNMNDKADRIIKEVENIEDVKTATVVITEHTALVGINLTSGTKGELNSEIKNKVEDAVKKADKDITKVSVSADPDIFTRIENISKEIGNGRPLSGFGSEIEEIIRRITPSM